MQIISESLKNLILTQTKPMADRLEEANDPLFKPGEQSDLARTVRSMCQGHGKKTYKAQLEVICAIVKGFLTKRALGIIGEMGTGKTLVASFVLWCMKLIFKHSPRALVLCPATLITTWEREFRSIFGDSVKVIDMNGPNAIAMLSRLRAEPAIPGKPEVWICGLHRMKTASPWQPSYFIKKTYERRDVKDDYGNVTPNALVTAETPICPRCCKPQLNLLKTRRNICGKCGEPLWGPVKDGRTYAPVNYIRKFLPAHFQFLIVDEVHKCKGSSTIQGAILGQLSAAIEKVLVLTGTLSGGKASDIFHLLQRVFALNYSKEERARLLPPFNNLTEFVEEFGSLERVRTQFDDDPATGRATPDDNRVTERPGISPQIFRRFFADCCAFLRISDIADQMPGYDEILELIPMDDDIEEEYNRLEPELRREVSKALYQGDTKVLGQMIHTLLAWPDMPQKQVQVYNRKYDVVATAESIDVEMTAKDRRLVELVHDAKERGRKALIYAEYTGKWGADKHLARILEKEGLRPLILKSGASNRLEWIETKMASGEYDCLISHAQKVETGLNLYGFPTIIFWQTTQSVFMLRQACRRSWRPGQTEDVEVYFLINQGSMQEMQMTLIASKLHAALILEGELTENGLVALSNLGDSMTLELAKALVGESRIGDLQETFRMYRTADVEAVTSTESATGSGKVIRFSIATARRIGALCGFENTRLDGSFLGCKMTIEPNAAGAYDIIVNDKTVGEWTGDMQDSVVLKLKSKSALPLLIQPQPAFPGMVSLTVYRLPAAA